MLEFDLPSRRDNSPDLWGGGNRKKEGGQSEIKLILLELDLGDGVQKGRGTKPSVCVTEKQGSQMVELQGDNRGITKMVLQGPPGRQALELLCPQYDTSTMDSSVKERKAEEAMKEFECLIG